MNDLQIHCEAAAKLNFACHQNDFAVLRDLRIENLNPDEAICDLLVTIESDPDFIQKTTLTVDRIDPGATASVRIRDVPLNGQFLLGLGESIQGTLHVRINQSSDLLAEHSQPIEILARNEWGGAGFMPELLAAFCMPNDPAVDRILADASTTLRRAGKPDGIDGYKSGSRQRVWEIAASIYASVANLQLKYSLPPTSFESNGQKIRMPSSLVKGGVATCLDTALLLAAAFEQAGLNPIIALTKEHAMAGVWLQPEKLASVTNDEAEVLRKRFQLDELILVESTLLTQYPAPPFSLAIERGIDQLSPDADGNFVSAIDISRARAHKITPLGFPASQEQANSLDGDDQKTETILDQSPALPDFDQEDEEEVPETPLGRLDRWQRKLLDLSARNPLLNHKSPKSSLSILCPNPGRLEDKIATGKKITIAPTPKASSQEQDKVLHEERTGERIDESYARDALEQNQVLVNLPKQELEKRLIEIYRKTQTSLQEGGANTLYLALGFLLWKRDEKDERRFRAPLILMPVSLQRKSVRSGVKIHAHDDEPRFNTTLLEMLKKDFGVELGSLEASLPEDDSGIDVHKIWTMARRAIKDVPGFEVVEDVVLGHFSFAKYLMWKDLVDRTEDLRQNSVVKHLIDTPRDPYPSEGKFVNKEDLDQDFQPSDFLTPLPADSSQMAVIASAERDKDFVIIGPPGTGKSQTISNMIAHLLGKGKTVLFVSEKTAALDVVHRRLEEINLGRFCLQLHSNKARKADVLAQLKDSWSFGSTKTEDQWIEEAGKLGELRNKLNRVVHHLHRTRRNGLTAHSAIGTSIRDSHLTKSVKFEWPTADFHSTEDYLRLNEVVSNLQIQAIAAGPFSDSPFHSIAHCEWSPTWQSSFQASAAALEVAVKQTADARSRLLDALQVDFSDQSWQGLESLADLCSTLKDAYRMQLGHALDTDGRDRIDALEKAIKHLRCYSDAQTRLSCSYDAFAWRELDGKALSSRWAEIESFWFLKRFFAKRRFIKELRLGGAHGKPDPHNDPEVLAELRHHGLLIDSLDRALDSIREWESHESDHEALETHRAVAERLRTDIARLSTCQEERKEASQSLQALLDQGNESLGPEGGIGLAADAYRSASLDLWARTNDFNSLAGRELRSTTDESPNALTDLHYIASQVLERSNELRGWCQWQVRRNQAIDLDLAPLVAAIESGEIPMDEIQSTFSASYCQWFSSRLFDEDEVIRTFSSAEHSDSITQFRAADEAFLLTTAQYVGALLSKEIPGQNDVPRSSQWGILKREITKRSRHKPVRQLMQEASGAVTKLAPCLMMSPLSVAQYLPADQNSFDVVIFDEASQITVWDAVGAIARGNQVVVAGDPKQMPPTNFFARSDDDADGDIDYEGDMESILDELQSSNIPELTLNLHYRSRKESLIAFSNSRYYDNGLVTFPAPVQPDLGVSLVVPSGHYDRGKSRTNRGEAEAIVNEVTSRLVSEDPDIRNQTIGVVTFNSEQQSLIQDLLDQARSNLPEIEWAFSEDKIESVFVKNLETVQGDERDVILFSVTYGPDEANHLTMNFGPLNKQGGERRLNVAMTRARSQMVVFSTLEADRIDLSRTSARAVADLKHFLEYAKKGPSAIAALDRGSVGGFDSPFEAAVASRLRDRGWTVRPQIGVSAYRVDLGIVHPDKPGRFLAGVECDGAMYHSSKYARERDKIRQSVLEGLGWNLLRVWSTDWWVDQASALDAINQGLNSLLQKERAQESEGTQSHTSKHTDLHTETASRQDYSTIHEGASNESNPDSLGDARCNLYSAAVVEVNAGKSELGTMAAQGLVKPIVEVVGIESPLHVDDLVRRITHAAGLQRAGARVQENVLRGVEIASTEGKIERRGEFLWLPTQETVPVRDRSKFSPQDKKFDRIASEEVDQSIYLTVRTHFSISNSDAISEAAQRLGFHRVTAPMKLILESSLAGLIEREVLLQKGSLLHEGTIHLEE